MEASASGPPFSLQMERLAFFPVAIITALIAVRLDLTYVGLAILVGIAIPIASMMSGKETFSSTTLGYTLAIVGLALLVVAYFVCSHYGISFETLDQDRSFPKTVRRLPYFGVSFLTSGVTAMAISKFWQQRG